MISDTNTVKLHGGLSVLSFYFEELFGKKSDITKRKEVENRFSQRLARKNFLLELSFFLFVKTFLFVRSLRSNIVNQLPKFGTMGSL